MDKWILLLTVFLSGMLVMMMELIGTRLMAPFFGSSIHIWTIMIGSILGFLSLGYWIGGRIADKKATFERLGFILFLNALSCLLLIYSAKYVLINLVNSIPFMIGGAVIATVLLFSLPSILFGIVSPYAAKLQIHSLKHSGTTIGNLYALGTIGSITGTFLTGFYLVSVLGSFQLLFLICIVLLLNSMILARNKFILLHLFILFSTIYFGFISPVKQYEFAIRDIIAVENTAYSDYYIYQQKTDEGIQRMLLTDFQTAQSKYLLNNPETIVPSYLKFFTLAQCYNVNNSVLLLGGGAFTYPNYYMRTFNRGQMDVVEIDPELTQISQEYFELPTKMERVNIINEDGRVFLNNNKKKYDTVLVDVFTNFTPPFQIISKEAVEKMYASLNDKGMVIMNIPSKMKGNEVSLVDAEMKILEQTFDTTELYQVVKNKDLRELQGFILIGYKGSPQMSNTCLAKEAGLLENRLEFKPKPDTPLFTDAFAPVEYVISR